jgi:hypothetical protein
MLVGAEALLILLDMQEREEQGEAEPVVFSPEQPDKTALQIMAVVGAVEQMEELFREMAAPV